MSPYRTVRLGEQFTNQKSRQLEGAETGIRQGHGLTLSRHFLFIGAPMNFFALDACRYFAYLTS